MRERIGNLAAIVILGLCLGLAVPTFFAVQQITAFTFGYEGSVLVVTAVDPEQIGGRIDIRRAPTGGTRIALSWSSA